MSTSTRTRPSWARERSRPAHSATPAAGRSAVYRRRRPTATPLYPIVQHHLETFLARAAEADPWGEGVAGWVEDDFRAYLRCGILAHGFARVRCDDCAAERLVAFSCKGRGVCRSCNTHPSQPALTRRHPRHSLPKVAETAFGFPSMGQAVKTHLAYTLDRIVLTASVRCLRRPGRSFTERE